MSLYDRQVSVVRPSSVVVRPSSFTISNDISKAVWPKLWIFGIKHPQERGTKNIVFCSDRIRTLVVTMATYTSHRLIMEKSGNCKFLLSHWRYLSFIFGEMFIE